MLYINTKDQKKVIVALKKDGNPSAGSGRPKGRIVDELSSQNEFGSQVLLPLIVDILKKNNLQFNDLTSVEVEEGPGSFTGLKVGAAVAQALGFALNIPVNGKLNQPVDVKYR